MAGRHIKSKYYFFNNIPDFQYRLYNEQDLAALIFLEPDFQSFISEAFGISRINNQLDIFGELDLDIENFTKNAEQLKIYWKKNKNISQKMLFRYFYPIFWDLIWVSNYKTNLIVTTLFLLKVKEKF